MSNILDDTSAQLALRVRAERTGHRWSLAELAGRSGVSKAMLSKIEREEVSPTAAVLVRIAGAFNLTLAGLVAPATGKPQQVLRASEQPRWQDPGTGYIRRQIFQSAENPMELVEVELPSGAHVAFPASSYSVVRRVLWLIAGRLEIHENKTVFALQTGDRMEFGPPSDTEFRNPSAKPCRYLLAQLRL